MRPLPLLGVLVLLQVYTGSRAGVVSTRHHQLGEEDGAAAVSVHNGAKAALGQFPWMLAVVADGAAFCGGAIIAEDWALTSGHCVDGMHSFWVTAGSLLSQDGDEPSRQQFYTTTSFRHPTYNARFKDNDIGLIHLNAAFTYDHCDPDVSPDLMFAELQVSPGRVCYDFYGSAWLLNKLCVATGGDGKSSCRGDGGSPLALREADGNWTVVGVASFGAADGCTLGLPVVFTRVASFLAFVEEVTAIEARN
ncbi:chymotrypsinogen 2-like [Thrips palmi]|uniref:Chymotrypsinogen 2-like n=1 Tax=Thrips palmi TaxID=161013 RepID=A0A6P8ZAB0_THRPL|nr:chymotrypsinogen 2-like [Thrips palmi]